jgi:hypothetical protein
MSKRPTHIGIIKGCDSRTPGNYKAQVFLRETKCYWIGGNGDRYNKKTGRASGDWPMYRLELDTVKKLTSETLIETKGTK